MKTDPLAYKPPPGIPAAALVHERDVMRSDPLAMIRGGYLRVRTKDMELVPFVPNTSQQKILDAIQQARRAHQAVRIVVLKARQMGVSTLSQAIAYAFSSMRSNLNAFVMADDDDGAKYLFSMNETFWEEMDRLHSHLAPRRSKSSERRIVFSGKRSAIYIETANNKRAGRKYTIHVLHASECAFWSKFKETMRGMMQAIPDKPETIAILETTANGTNDFCKFWRRIKRERKEGTTQWIPIFLSWKDHGEYVRKFSTDYERQMFESSLSGKEVELRKDHGLSLEQLHWRRWKISNDFTGDEEGFQVEFPLTDDEAFVSTQKAVFPEKIIKAHQSTITPARLIGDLYLDGRRPVFMPSKDGHLKIYELPKAGHRYVIGADSCESSAGQDYACAQVIDRTTWTQAAMLYGRIPPEVFGEEIARLGLFYNMAMIAPEINGPGFATIAKLSELGYPNVCRRQKTIIDERTGMIGTTEELGWRTDAKNKGMIVRETAEGLRNMLIVMRDQSTLDELSQYVVKDVSEEGHIKYGADEGYHDDTVMALMIAQHYARQLPEFQEERQQQVPNLTRVTGYG